MKRRIIINIDADDLTDLEVIDLVQRIVQMGRVSTSGGRKHYCALATLTPSGQIAATKRTDSTDTFTIWK